MSADRFQQTPRPHRLRQRRRQRHRPRALRPPRYPADVLHIEPNGRNINDGCGALHPEHVAAEVVAAAGQFDIGITLDGDADRALFCDCWATSSTATPCCSSPPAT